MTPVLSVPITVVFTSHYYQFSVDFLVNSSVVVIVLMNITTVLLCS